MRTPGKVKHDAGWICGEDGKEIARVSYMSGVGQEGQVALDNARFIVTAWNCHDDLVAVLLAIKHMALSGELCGEIDELQELIELVLIKATEGPNA